MLAGGAVVFAKLQEYSWWLIGDSWRTAVAVLAGAGLAALLVGTVGARAEGTHRNTFDDVEIGAAVIALGLAVTGMIVTSELVFYSLAAVMGALWLTAIIRHAVHTFSHTGTFRHVSA